MAKNYINYQIELCEENSEKIDAANQLFIGVPAKSTSTNTSDDTSDDTSGDDAPTLDGVDTKLPF